MPRVIVDGEAYEGLSSSALSEDEYERLLLQEAGTLFPDLYVVPFKEPVEYADQRRKADLALIDRQFRRWWVGEVELAHHSFRGHVLPQVEVLARGDYGEAHAAALARAAPELDAGILREMLRGAPPQVVVIVNTPCPDWVAPLRRERALLMIVELFRSELDRLLYRINGAEVALPGEEISRCRPDPLLPRMLRVDSPAQLAPLGSESVTIRYAGRLTQWRLLRIVDQTWLSPERGSPFAAGGRGFRLLRGEDGSLELEAL